MTGVKDVASGFSDYVSWATDPRPRIGWGLPFFDSPTGGGLARSEICMVMAFSSVGKTTLGLNIIRNNPEVPALFFSLEMNWRMVVARLAAIEAPTTTRSLELQTQAGEKPEVFQETADRFRFLACDDTPAITLKQASASFEEAARVIGETPRLVVFDYLELIGGSGMLGKAEAVDKASQKLRDWTREHDCSTVVLHQVGKGDGGDKPLDLGSGRYGGYAPMDYVVGAYAPRLANGITEGDFEACKDEIYLQLLKNRAGGAHPVGVKHRLDTQTMRLTEWGRQSIWPTNTYQQGWVKD